MIYSKIDYLLSKKKLTQKDLIHYIKMSRQGYYTMIEKESMKVSTLELMSEFFDVPISYWFEEEGKESVVNEPVAGYDLRREIKELKDTLEILKLLIKKQESELTGLKSQLNKHTSF